MKSALLLSLYSLVIVIATIPNPSRFSTYLLENRWESGLPLSYYVPPTYFSSIPEDQRPHFFTEGEIEPQCNGEFVPAEKMNAYQFQTEELLTTAGLNLYDGAMWTVAVSLLGHVDQAEQYMKTTLVEHKTLQFANIKADKACRGIIEYGQCIDAGEDGGCGFCYGDQPDKSLSTENAYFFRMVSDVWGFDGAGDARCPELDGKINTWKWNDYRPVSGENSWALLIGPLQTAFLKAGKKIDSIPDDSTGLYLALSIIPALIYIYKQEKMLVPNHGAIYYAPRNTWDSSDPTIGDNVSTENNASILAGLKMLLYILTTRTSGTYDSYIPRVDSLVKHVTNYIRNSYNFKYGYFSQGGKYEGDTGIWTWVEEPYFAVDCQTWVITVLGKEEIDSWFGEGTCLKIWNVTKEIGGYQKTSSSWVRGLGFTENSKDQIFSGEWSLGGINMLNVLANSYKDENTKKALLAEAQFMREAIETDLVYQGTLKNGNTATGVNYANRRYFIPFGWYANPLWSTASAAWTVTTDLNFNPFYLGGDLKSTY